MTDKLDCAMRHNSRTGEKTTVPYETAVVLLKIKASCHIIVLSYYSNTIILVYYNTLLHGNVPLAKLVGERFKRICPSIVPPDICMKWGSGPLTKFSRFEVPDSGAGYIGQAVARPQGQFLI